MSEEALAYELLSDKLIEDLEAFYGRQKALRIFNELNQNIISLVDNWDFCKSVGDNVAKIIGELLQTAGIEYFTRKTGPFRKKLTKIVEFALDKVGINLGNFTEKAWHETNSYLTERSRVEEKLKADFYSMSEEDRAKATAMGYAPGLPGWNTKVSEMQDVVREKYENSIKDLAPYSQIPLFRLDWFAKKHGCTADDLVKANGLLKTRDEDYALVPEDGNLKLPNGKSVNLPFTCDIKNKIIQMSMSDVEVFENEGKIEFTINISRKLDKDFTLKLSTIDGSAKGDKDFTKIIDKEIAIEAGKTSKKFSIKVARDRIYENKENFMLKAHYEDESYSGKDLKKVLNKTIMAKGAIIDFPEDKCPQPTHKNFDLSFNLPSSTSYGVGAGAGGSGGGAGGSAYWGIGSIPSISIPSKQPTPDIPYVECPDEPELNSMLVIKIPQATNNTAPANSNPLNSQVANENDDSDSCSDGMCVPNRSEQNSDSGNKNKASYAPNANNANSKQSGAALNLSDNTDPDKPSNKLYFDMNSDGFKERMLDWFG